MATKVAQTKAAKLRALQGRKDVVKAQVEKGREQLKVLAAQIKHTRAAK